MGNLSIFAQKSSFFFKKDVIHQIVSTLLLKIYFKSIIHGHDYWNEATWYNPSFLRHIFCCVTFVCHLHNLLGFELTSDIVPKLIRWLTCFHMVDITHQGDATDASDIWNKEEKDIFIRYCWLFYMYLMKIKKKNTLDIFALFYIFAFKNEYSHRYKSTSHHWFCSHQNEKLKQLQQHSLWTKTLVNVVSIWTKILENEVFIWTKKLIMNEVFIVFFFF